HLRDSPPAGGTQGRLSRKVRRVALSARAVERRDADRPAERDWTADQGAAHGGLAAVGRVAQGEARWLQAAGDHAPLGPETGRGNSVVDPRDLPIEPGQLALAKHVDVAGPGLAAQGLGLRGVP